MGTDNKDKFDNNDEIIEVDASEGYEAPESPDGEKKEMKKAVDCGYWNMFRYNPELKKQGKNPLTIDSKPAKEDYKEFILGEARYSSLTRSFPERAEELFDKAVENSKEQRKHLEKLAQLYAPDAE